MSEKEELLKEVDVLINSFKSLPLYNRYISLKKAISEDKHLQDLLKNEEDIKKSLKFLKNEEKQEAIKKAKAYLDEYNNSELVLNYKACKSELLTLLEPLNSIL